ncbi:MAG: hypothetical protein ACOCUL_03175 [Bacteroidota bacterium]
MDQKQRKTIFPVGHPLERNIIKPKRTYFISTGALTKILPRRKKETISKKTLIVGCKKSISIN